MSKRKGNPRARPARSSKTSVSWIVGTVLGLAAVVAAGVIWLAPPTVSPEEADVVVYKTATCGCCREWVDHLRDHDLSVAVVNVRETQTVQQRLGVPSDFGSCHTAKAGDYLSKGMRPPISSDACSLSGRSTFVALQYPACRLAHPAWRVPIRSSTKC